MEPSCFGSGNAALEQPAEKGRASIDLATTFGIVFGVLGALLLRRAYRSINVIPPLLFYIPREAAPRQHAAPRCTSYGLCCFKI